MPSPYPVPPFLQDLLAARSPSGCEGQAQAAFEKHVGPAADSLRRDKLGNRIATLNPEGSPVLMLAGHLDEVGFLITHIDDQGFLYFQTLGRHDCDILPGRVVSIIAKDGSVTGVTGKKPVHQSKDDSPKSLKAEDIWIDIGASGKLAAMERVRPGDSGVFEGSLEILHGSIAAARCFDNRAGAYIVGKTLIRLANEEAPLAACIHAVGTSQEEMRCRGAAVTAHALRPDIGIAIDVTYAMDYPGVDQRIYGGATIGGGPVICRGPNISPLIYDRLVEAAQAEGIPYQIEADPAPTSTDARMIQIAGDGAATGLVSIALRYMHTPVEVVDLRDLDRCVDLLVAFAKRLTPEDRFEI